MNSKKFTFKLFFVFVFVSLNLIPVFAAVKPSINRVEPPFWWTGFKNPSLQLLVYGVKISETQPLYQL